MLVELVELDELLCDDKLVSLEQELVELVELLVLDVELSDDNEVSLEHDADDSLLEDCDETEDDELCDDTSVDCVDELDLLDKVD